VRISTLETETKWMKGTLDEIRQHTKEVADYAHQLVKVAHETATMSEAVSRAFDEIRRERDERRAEQEKIEERITPLVNGWQGVSETSNWIKAGIVGVFCMNCVLLFSLIIK